MAQMILMCVGYVMGTAPAVLAAMVYLTPEKSWMPVMYAMETVRPALVVMVFLTQA